MKPPQGILRHCMEYRDGVILCHDSSSRPDMCAGSEPGRDSNSRTAQPPARARATRRDTVEGWILNRRAMSAAALRPDVTASTISFSWASVIRGFRPGMSQMSLSLLFRESLITLSVHKVYTIFLQTIVAILQIWH